LRVTRLGAHRRAWTWAHFRDACRETEQGGHLAEQRGLALGIAPPNRGQRGLERTKVTVHRAEVFTASPTTHASTLGEHLRTLTELLDRVQLKHGPRAGSS